MTMMKKKDDKKQNGPTQLDSFEVKSITKQKIVNK